MLNEDFDIEFNKFSPPKHLTYSPCCQIIRIGLHDPRAMHSSLCRYKHNGELGSTIVCAVSDGIDISKEELPWVMN